MLVCSYPIVLYTGTVYVLLVCCSYILPFVLVCVQTIHNTIFFLYWLHPSLCRGFVGVCYDDVYWACVGNVTPGRPLILLLIVQGDQLLCCHALMVSTDHLLPSLFMW